MKKRMIGSLALLFGTMIWGGAFVAQSAGMDYTGPFTFQAARCLLAVIALVLFTLLFELKDLKNYWKRWANKKLWLSGMGCGLALFIASSFQQIGLVYTSAGKAGFITAMYIVFVPLIGIFRKQRISPAAVACVGIAIVGLYLLSCAGVSEINMGDVFVLLCALSFAVQITLIDKFAPGLDALRLNCVQILTTGVISAVPMILWEKPAVAPLLDAWFPLVFAGVFSMGVAYSLQIVGQKNVPPTAASMIMSMESVFAALSGWLILQERMTGQELLGCVLVFSAVLLSQIPPKQKKVA